MSTGRGRSGALWDGPELPAPGRLWPERGKLLWVRGQASVLLTRASKNADTRRGLWREKGSGAGCVTLAVSPSSLRHPLPGLWL